MHTSTVRVTCVAAYSAWALAFTLALAGTVALAAHRPSLALGLYAHDMLVIGGAVVLSVRAIAEKALRIIVNHIDIAADLNAAPVRQMRS